MGRLSEGMARKFMLMLLAYCVVAAVLSTAQNGAKRKRDVRDMTDREIEELYEEWERNDEEELPDDEKPPHLRPKPNMNIDLETMKQMAGNPDDLMRLSKKGQSIMMFASVVDPNSGAKAPKDFTNKMSTLWQSMLNNNHIDVQVYAVEDDRLLFMFADGAQAWEARDVLVKQKACRDVTLEGKMTEGLGAKLSSKNEL